MDERIFDMPFNGGTLVTAFFGLLLILSFKIMPERIGEFLLRNPFKLKGYKKVIFFLAWLALAAILELLALIVAGLFNALVSVGIDAIFKFLHI